MPFRSVTIYTACQIRTSERSVCSPNLKQALQRFVKSRGGYGGCRVLRRTGTQGAWAARQKSVPGIAAATPEAGFPVGTDRRAVPLFPDWYGIHPGPSAFSAKYSPTRCGKDSHGAPYLPESFPEPLTLLDTRRSRRNAGASRFASPLFTKRYKSRVHGSSIGCPPWTPYLPTHAPPKAFLPPANDCLVTEDDPEEKFRGLRDAVNLPPRFFSGLSSSETSIVIRNTDPHPGQGPSTTEALPLACNT